jgi:hypothetical protein
MPVGNLPGWNQIYANDFTQSVALGSQASAFGMSDYGVVPDTSGMGLRDTAATVSEANSLLNVWVHTDSQGQPVGACLIPTAPGVSYDDGQLYGRYDIRMRADSAQGFKFVFLLWPDSESWPGDGEIDFPEADLNAAAVGGATHFEDGTSGNSQDWWTDPGINYQQWHTYTIEWMPGVLDYFIDGTLVHSDTQATAEQSGYGIPDTPMHPVIQVETVTDGSGAPASSSQGNVQIDWLTAYSMAT